jgi:hypothetical protein
LTYDAASGGLVKRDATGATEPIGSGVSGDGSGITDPAAFRENLQFSQGLRAVLSSPYDYATYPLPPDFKGLTLYVLDPSYVGSGYTLGDLVSYMAAFHGATTFWSQVLASGSGAWTVPGFAVLNDSSSASIPLGLYSGLTLTSQPGRENPGSEVYLDPYGMAVLRFLDTELVSVHGDLFASGGGGGGYYGSY